MPARRCSPIRATGCVRAAVAAGHEVHAVPGPSALLGALVVAGLPTDRFWFEGFLPAKAGQRRTRLQALAALDATSVVYESPRRIAATLSELAEIAGPDREVVVARELTKRFEEVTRGPVGALAASFSEAVPKGEIVLMIAPSDADAGRAASADDVEARLGALVDGGRGEGGCEPARGGDGAQAPRPLPAGAADRCGR